MAVDAALLPYFASANMLFDTRSWVDIKALKTKRFGGFTYKTPKPEEILPP